MTKQFILLACALAAGAASAQSPNSAISVAQMPAPARLTFGMIAGNTGFVRSAFSKDAKGSVLDATRREPRSETREGPNAIAALIAGLPSITGKVRSGNCKPGVPGKFTCEYRVQRHNRQLLALIDIEGDLITSIIFTVTGDHGHG